MITYYIGAGASVGALPIVNGIPEAINQMIEAGPLKYLHSKLYGVDDPALIDRSANTYYWTFLKMG